MRHCRCCAALRARVRSIARVRTCTGSSAGRSQTRREAKTSRARAESSSRSPGRTGWTRAQGTSACCCLRGACGGTSQSGRLTRLAARHWPAPRLVRNRLWPRMNASRGRTDVQLHLQLRSQRATAIIPALYFRVRTVQSAEQDRTAAVDRVATRRRRHEHTTTHQHCGVPKPQHTACNMQHATCNIHHATCAAAVAALRRAVAVGRGASHAVWAAAREQRCDRLVAEPVGA